MIQDQLKVLELFAGSRSIGKEAEKLGYSVFSVDKFVKKNMDCICDIKDLTKQFIIDSFGYPNIIWASPVCSVWSKAGWFNHWDTDIYRITKQFLPKTDYANESIFMIKKTIEIFSWFKDAVFYMENPEGMLAFHPVIRLFDIYGIQNRKVLITYCQYGHKTRKPTNIWTNNFEWFPKVPCKNRSKCHIKSPRDTNTGIMSFKNSYDRSIIPEQLCKEILLSTKKDPDQVIEEKTLRQTLINF